METTSMWERVTRLLRGKNDAENKGCSAERCQTRPTIAIAVNDARTTFMCALHAIAWSESSLCRDVAQHNSSASPAALSSWISTNRA